MKKSLNDLMEGAKTFFDNNKDLTECLATEDGFYYNRNDYPAASFHAKKAGCKVIGINKADIPVEKPVKKTKTNPEPEK
jgi:hypothetical protein